MAAITPPHTPNAASDVLCAVLAVALVALLAFIGWEAGWWLQFLGGPNPFLT